MWSCWIHSEWRRLFYSLIIVAIFQRLVVILLVVKSTGPNKSLGSSPWHTILFHSHQTHSITFFDTSLGFTRLWSFSSIDHGLFRTLLRYVTRYISLVVNRFRNSLTSLRFSRVLQIEALGSFFCVDSYDIQTLSSQFSFKWPENISQQILDYSVIWWLLVVLRQLLQ